jgi:hypothetical protein
MKKRAEKTDLTKTSIKHGQCDCVIGMPFGDSPVFRGALNSTVYRACHYMPHQRSLENPDLSVGSFHIGLILLYRFQPFSKNIRRKTAKLNHE